MSSSTEGSAHLILRLLLDPAFTPGPLEKGDHDRLLGIAQAGHVLLRVVESLGRCGIPLSPIWAETAALERQRVRATVQAIRGIQDVCARRDVSCVFLKSFKHCPDMGGDIDLLVGSRSPGIDRHLERELGFKSETRGFTHAIAGSVAYQLADCPSPLEIFHGRLGIAGEYSDYADQVVGRRRQVTVEGTRFWVPSTEDQLLLQALGLLWVRSSVRLSDVVSAIQSLREQDLDWDYLLGTGWRLGALTALSCSLGYAEQVHRRLFHQQLLPPYVRSRLSCGRWPCPRPGRDGYSLPAARLLGPLYAAKFGAALRARDGACLLRLTLVPGLGLAALLRRGGRAMRRLRPARPDGGPELRPRAASAALRGGVPAPGVDSNPGGSQRFGSEG